MIQETLQEAAEKYAEAYRCPATNENEYCKHDIISAINFGAKLQKEQFKYVYLDGYDDGLIDKEVLMYSEEHVIELLQKALTHKDDGEIGSLVTAQKEIRTANFHSWFNKFKNQMKL
jgi:hypothetical protein